MMINQGNKGTVKENHMCSWLFGARMPGPYGLRRLSHRLGLVCHSVECTRRCNSWGEPHDERA